MSKSILKEAMRSFCEGILDIIKELPYDIARLNGLAGSLGRKSFVVRNPVYEDLKSSGNLDIISDGDLRNTLLKFYQDITYAETVFANNNEAIHKLGDQFTENGLADLGFTENLYRPGNPDFSIEVTPFRNAEKIISSQLENELVRFTFHNLLAYRGRLASLHVHLLIGLAEENKLLIDQIEDQLSILN